MIFVVLGTQKEQFKRIIEYVVNSEELKNEKILIQNGYTKYDNDYDKQRITMLGFINSKEFNDYIVKANFVISHGGVGSIFSSLLCNKKVLAIPRLKKYDEHVDDHQIEICNKLQDLGYILCYNEQDEGNNIFDDKIKKLKQLEFKKYIQDKSFLNILRKEI